MISRNYWLIVLLFLLAWPNVHVCSAARTAKTRLKAGSVARIRNLLQRSEWRMTQVGVCFAKANGGGSLFESESHRMMLPASNTKLFTSALALNVLGPEYRFRTELKGAADVDGDGTLQGPVCLVGAGDPSLRREDLKLFARAVQDAGIRRIAGSIIADATLITDGPFGLGWEWDDLPYYYAAEVYGLSIDRNQLTIVIQPPGSEDGQVAITLDPPTDFVRVESQLRVSKSGEASTDFGKRSHDRTFTITGTVPAGGTPIRQSVSLPDPHLYAAHCFKELLSMQGIGSGVEATGEAPSNARTIGVVESPPLKELIRHLNKVSDNLYAELLLRAAARKARGKATAAAGIDGMREWLKQQRIPLDEFRLVDGSGLSRHNLISPNIIVHLLQAMWNGPYRKPFVESLPIAGEDGTLRSRMRYSAGHKVVTAKTGTMGGVSTLSGYVTVNRQVYAFSIMVNNYIGTSARARELQEKVLLNLMEGIR